MQFLKNKGNFFLLKTLKINQKQSFNFCYSAYIEKIDKIEIIKSDTTDINFNLSTEEFLYEHSQLTHPVLFLWRNDKTIVIGRHQNPWKECFLQNMERDNVNLARRKTGGGAVYQDLGNSCFSFLVPALGEQYPLDIAKQIDNIILLNALKKFNIEATFSGRNDILLDNRKISGSAYKMNLGDKQGKGKKALHHGTMLLNLQSADVPKYLNPNKAKLKSKGVTSVISRITNLIDVNPQINHESFSKALEKEFIDFYSLNKSKDLEVIHTTLDKSELEKNDKINTTFKAMVSWDWIHGQTPKFSNSIDKKFDWGLIDFSFDVEKSKIVDAQVFSDCLYAEYITIMNEVLQNNKEKYNYDAQGVHQFCEDVKIVVQNEKLYVDYTNDIQSWIVEAI
ncbi:hypothetical protein PPERSA_08643 [Pseudocohnilembus persalinus]|uniref:lipoate--protein ligase n=1 Tax=Pseudocohnilembus persalinus TaxID=266149 RepID=A0A0V0R549_PSEPJ|nr:hypothetical protein PPERSA_08643 [Pseudocohnilembus persalinus]|eukprot:KRX09611.1 hypothetical protein PPERSA_08643 [Pseudocohnilembus persalinus]